MPTDWKTVRLYSSFRSVKDYANRKETRVKDGECSVFDW